MRLKVFSVVLLSCLLAVSTGYAIVNITDPTGNTSAPTGTGGEPADPGWANVGSVDNASGIYLGNGWVLTAGHVFSTSRTNTFITTGGQTYNWDGTNYHEIAGTDLALYKLSSTPELDTVTLAATSPTNGDALTMIGNGLTPQSTPTQYYVDTETDPWTWMTSSFPGADATVSGYLQGSGRDIRWGTNTVSGSGNDVGGIGHYFYTDFDLSGGTAYEAQAVTGDSGGSVFYYDGTQWVLQGLMVTVGTYNNQPGTSSGIGSAFDGNLTYIVDLAEYADEINALVPEPARIALLAGLLALLVVRLRGRRTCEAD